MYKSMQERIAKVAYELYEKRGRQDGHHDKDWLEAERLVKARISKEENLRKTGNTRAAAPKVAARKETSEETRKKLTKPAPKAAPSKGKKISREVTLS
jgi:Protein of unknown function (DUF2934)